MRMYKIRDKRTGKFSPGGQYGYLVDTHFTKNGKLFTEKGVQDYLQPLPWIKPKDYFPGCEVVEFEVKEAGTRTLAQVRQAGLRRHAAELRRENRRVADEQMRTFGETF